MTRIIVSAATACACCEREAASFGYRGASEVVVSAATVCGLPAIPTKAWGPSPGALTV